MCTTLSNNYTVNLPTTCCSGTYTNITVNSDLIIPAGSTLTVTNTLTINNGATITVQGNLNTSFACTSNGAITIDGGHWTSTSTSSHITTNAGATLDLINGGKLTCNGNFTNNDTFTMGYACSAFLNLAATFNATVTTDANAPLTINIVSRANTSTTTWAGDYHYISGKVTDYNAVVVNLTGLIEIDSCKFRTGNFSYSCASADLIVSNTGTYIEVDGNASGANAWTTDPAITYYRSGTGGNFGGATAVAQQNPC